MVVVRHACEIRLWEPQAKFALQTDPPYIVVSNPWEFLGPTLAEQDGLSIDSDQQLVYPSPMEVPHNNFLAAAASAAYDDEKTLATTRGGIDSTLPSVTWSIDTGFTLAAKIWPIWGGETKPIELEVIAEDFADSDSGEIALIHSLDACAYRFTSNVRQQPRKRLAAGGAGGTTATPNSLPEQGISLKLGDDWYRVRSFAAGVYHLEHLPAGKTLWSILERIAPKSAPTSDLETGARGPADQPLVVEFRLIAGYLSVRLGDGQNPVVVKVESSATKFSQARFAAKKVLSAQIYGRPVYWPTTATFTSSPQDVAFSVTEEPEPVLTTFGPEGTITVPPSSSMLGPKVSYQANWLAATLGTYKGRNYAKEPTALHAVALKYQGRESHTPKPYTNVMPKATIVEHQFNPETLQIVSSATCEFPAYKHDLLPDGSQGFWGEWSIETGQRAIEIWVNRTLYSGEVGLPELRFTGYFGTRRTARQSGADGAWRIQCRGREIQALSPKYNIPVLRGWNVFFAARHLANLAGFVDDDLAFLASVPPDMFSESLDEDGNPALMLGTRGISSERLSGQSPWAILGRLAQQIGYMLFVDVEGRLHFRKFRIPPGIKRIFYESDREAGGLEGCWSVEVDEDLSPVRSGLTLIGVERTSRAFIVNRRTDHAVIDDPTAFNHLGYPSDAVWIDPLFSDFDFASDAATKSMQVLRLPTLTVQLTTWLQPDVFPLDTILVSSQKLGIGFTPLLVTGVRDTIPAGGLASTTITAAYVPDID